MHDMIAHTLNVFLGFFAIMNPVANTAVFIGLTSDDSSYTKKLIALKALLVAFCIVSAFALLGNVIFHMFGITLPALRITGGVLVFLIGYNMLNGERSKMHKPRGQDQSADDEVAISPLAVPILAGPGTIATAINFSSAGGWSETLITIAMFGLLCGITYGFFRGGERIVSTLGKGGLNIVTRLMGLILAVIGVQMLIEGVAGAVAHWQDYAG
ncbi:MarC family protein [Rubritalea marina]|uniref:MarC family protein n=1 Tax=Rubritalea marina TaxID=361055 RepID=UPI0003791323|nr:MarC family protein [Rubritalea marina]